METINSNGSALRIIRANATNNSQAPETKPEGVKPGTSNQTIITSYHALARRIEMLESASVQYGHATSNLVNNMNALHQKLSETEMILEIQSGISAALFRMVQERLEFSIEQFIDVWSEINNESPDKGTLNVIQVLFGGKLDE